LLKNEQNGQKGFEIQAAWCKLNISQLLPVYGIHCSRIKIFDVLEFLLFKEVAANGATV